MCKWLHRTLHDTHAVAAYEYILPLMVRPHDILSLAPLFMQSP